MIKLCSAFNLPEAYLKLHLLQQSGIEAIVLNENAQGGLGELPAMEACPELWLAHEEDMLKAREIIRLFDKTPVNHGQRICPACGESNPANFELCWKCGNELG